MESARTVLFVCLRGSGKSLIAAEYFRRLAAQRGSNARAVAAGIDPDHEIPLKVREGLLKDGIDVGAVRPRRVTPEDLIEAWRVVSFGCDLSGVAPPEVSVERWDDIPAVSAGFDRARDEIVARLPGLLANTQ